MSLRRSTRRRARLDEEIEETQAKAEEDKLKAEEAAKKSGSEASGKPTIDEEVAAPTDNVKQAAAEAKEAAAAACDDARKEERGRAAQRRNQRLQRQRPQHRPKSKEKGDFRSPGEGCSQCGRSQEKCRRHTCTNACPRENP